MNDFEDCEDSTDTLWMSSKINKIHEKLEQSITVQHLWIIKGDPLPLIIPKIYWHCKLMKKRTENVSHENRWPKRLLRNIAMAIRVNVNHGLKTHLGT